MTDWRPITDDERPRLVALGALVRALRDEIGLTQSAWGRLANVSASQIGAIERARKRTRATTLRRLVDAVVLDEERAEVLVAEMIETAGPALGLEEDEAQRQRTKKRLQRRERRWGSKWLRESVVMNAETQRTVRRSISLAEHTGDADKAEGLRALLAKVQGDGDRLAAQLADVERDETEGERAAGPDEGPAARALREYARSLLPPGRSKGQIIYPTPEQERRLNELKTAADVERAEQDRRR